MPQPITKRRQPKESISRPCLIAPELHAQWRAMERQGDTEKIMERTGMSRPTVNNALIYGHAHNQNLITAISDFFAERAMSERLMAEKLKELNQQNQENGTEPINQPTSGDQ